MFFQFSPVKKAPRKKPQQLAKEESEAVEVLSLIPFTHNPKITFENIHVNTTAIRKLKICNPTERDIQLSAIQNFPEELDVGLSWDTICVVQKSNVELEIEWTPTIEGAWRHTLHLGDGARVRRDVPIIFKSVSLQKNGKKGAPKGKNTKTGRPVFVSTKAKSPIPSKTVKKKLSPPKRKVLPNITNIVIGSPDGRTFNVEDGKENYNSSFLPGLPGNLDLNIAEGDERRFTYVLKPLTPTLSENLNKSNTDNALSDSLESPQSSLHATKTLLHISETYKESIETRLKSESFMLTPVTTTSMSKCLQFNPECCSTDEKSINVNNAALPRSRNGVCLFVTGKDEINLSGDTYVKGAHSFESQNINISTETYVKSPAKCDISSSTFVKDNSVGDWASLPSISPVPRPSLAARLESLRGDSVKSTIEANLWGDNETKTRDKYLGSIPEEAGHTDSFCYRILKRKADDILPTCPQKRAFIDTPSRISDWSKQGGCPTKVTKKSTGLEVQKDSKLVQIAKKDTHEVYVANPFLLAAIKDDFNPFMATSLYLDEDWMLEQEKRFKNWLNVLLTPHTDLHANEDGHPVNVQKLWQDCKRREVAAAPTPETVSNNYHTNSRLNALRKSALTLYRSLEMRTVLGKVATAVDANKLSLRQDRDIHLDIALQSEIMLILLSYNPLWLRIGLETIYKTAIPLSSNSDLMGLSSFLMARFFKDPYLLKKYKSIHAPKYKAEIKKFILRKFLALVYFLDQAKKKKIIAHDPCLFSKNAPIKESREALLKFARESVAAVGDITKYLKLFGYIVDHKQTYINEFKYAVNCLGVDLRDGVRLARAMEIILLRDNLTNQLRVPAISRLQKVHNMNIVFEALEKAGFNIEYDICAKDIVDGHKEKTLAFLWQIINKFHTPLMIKSATTIQTWWRSEGIVKKRAELREMFNRKSQAASKIQTWFRRRLLIRKLEQFVKLMQIYIENKRKNRAALIIQRNTKMYLARSKFVKLKEITIKLQSYGRRFLINNFYKQRISAAILIQSYTRMFIARRRYQKLKTTVRFVENTYIATQLMLIERQKYDDLRYAALKIQTTYRSLKQMRQARTQFLALKLAASTIQQRYRANKQRDVQVANYQRLKWASIVIQREIRAFRARRAFSMYRWAAIVIQTRFRATQEMKIHREAFLRIKSATLVIQRRYRAQQLMKKHSNYFAALKSSTLIVQRRFRANQQLKSDLARYTCMKNAALLIQRRFRATQIMKKCRLQFKLLREAAIYLQRKYTAILLMRATKSKYDSLKRAAICIQQRFRANQQRKIFQERYQVARNAAILIQRKFRAHQTMIFVHKEFVELKTKTLTIQRWFRATKLMRQQRLHYVQLKTVTIVIQRRYRAQREMQRISEDYAKLRQSALVFQRRYRARQSMRKDFANFNTLKRSVITVQQRFRANLLMKSHRSQFVVQRMAAIKIQRFFRAVQIMRKCRLEYETLRKAVIFIQNQFRANLQMRKDRENYQGLRKAVLRIQRHYRANLQRRIDYQNYQLMRNSAILLQRKFRAQKTMTFVRTEFTTIRTKTVTIQRWFRSTQLMKQQRNLFIQLKTTTIIIQRLYRAKLAMRTDLDRYVKLKNAAVVLQRRYRAKLAMRQELLKFTALKRSVIVIQIWFRAETARRVARTQFVALKQAAIVVQRRYRALIAMRQESFKYTNTRQAIIRIQSWYRMVKTRQRFTLLRIAVLTVQNQFRAQLKLKSARQSYLEQRQAAVVVQRRFRALLSMRQEYHKYNTLRKSVIKIQSWYRMNKARQRFSLLKSTVLMVQNRFRAVLKMKTARESYLQQKRAAVKIQRFYRNYLDAKRTAEENKRRNNAATLIQKNIRGYLVRKQYAPLLTPEAISARKLKKLQDKAAVRIQALWRGYKSRTLDRPEKLAISKIRRRLIVANQNVMTEKKLHFRVNSAVASLRRDNVTLLEVTSALEDIEYVTRRCMKTCTQMSLMAAHFYVTLKSTSRSPPEMIVCTIATNILINFAKHPPARRNCWSPEYLDSLLSVMLHWCDKEDPLFPAICTLLWLFAHNPQYRREILEIKDFKQIMWRIRTACARKERMTSKVNLKIASRFTPYKHLPLPTLRPDWGLDYKHKPKSFYNSLQALHCLLKILEV